MNLDIKNDKKAATKKEDLMREVTSTEPFLEAWPSVIIMTIIFNVSLSSTSYNYSHCFRGLQFNWQNKTWNHTYPINSSDHIGMCKDNYYEPTKEFSAILDGSASDYSFDAYCLLNSSVVFQDERKYHDKECDEYLISNYLPLIYCAKHPENNNCAVFGGFGGKSWFIITYFVSILTASLGIAKFLQVGPFSVLTNEGILGGICKWRFILMVLAIMTSMISKVILISLVQFNGISHNDIVNLIVKIFPNLLLSFTCIACSTGINKKFIKIILNYPAAWMLPIATFFVIGPRKSFCCSKASVHRHHLSFSKPFTIINIMLTFILLPIAMLQWEVSFNFKKFIANFLFYSVPIFISLIFNIIFLSLDENCCCQQSKKCFFPFCCSYKCFEHETFVIDTNTNDLKIVKIDK